MSTEIFPQIFNKKIQENEESIDEILAKLPHSQAEAAMEIFSEVFPQVTPKTPEISTKISHKITENVCSKTPDRIPSYLRNWFKSPEKPNYSGFEGPQSIMGCDFFPVLIF